MKRLQELKEWYQRLLLDVVSDDFMEVQGKIHSELEILFEQEPSLKTEENKKYFNYRG